jgi:phenylpyruvate tautomerase PptA (4-oxalocrotonate tautomerase family)
VHQALVTTLGIPAADRFQTITRRSTDEIICSSEFLGIAHSHQMVLVQITMAPRSVELKKALYLEIVSAIARETHFKSSDVIINLVESARENWSFGNGLAQFAQP